MPHCLAKEFLLPSLPFIQDRYEFVFEAKKEDENESVILVRCEGYEFFLKKRYRTKQGDYICKCEKISRGIPTGIIKGALRILAEFNQERIITHNLNNDSLKQKLLSPYFKKIDDFLNFDLKFELEIGFGSGRHLLNRAKENPQMHFVGIELHTPSIEQVLRQIEILGLCNVWIINFDARVFLELLPSNLCQAIYLHFPVPWEKKPHRRVWSKRFLKEAMRILQKGKMLELRSDDEGYFLYALQIALEEEQLQCKINKNIQKEVISKYEARWLKQNKNIYDLQVYAMKNDENLKKEYDFSFPQGLFIRSFDTIQRKKIIQNHWFLHIDSFYSNEAFCVLAISFGDFNQPQNKFVLLCKNKEALYLGGNPLPTDASYMAHLELVKIIEGEEVEHRH